MYIAIEGIKGAGKSSLLERLVPALKHEGLAFTCFNPTRAMPASSWWEQAYCQYAHDDQFVSDLYTARANYYAQRTDFNDDLILGDRSILTSFVTRWPTQPVKQLAYISKVMRQEYAVPLPDLVIYLDIPVQDVLERLKQRRRDYGLQDECETRLKAADAAYRLIFEQKDQFGLTNMQVQSVDATKSAESVFLQVLQCVKNSTLVA